MTVTSAGTFAGLLSFAVIACWAPEGRTWLCLFPFFYASACLTHFTNARAPKPPVRVVREVD